MNRDPTNPTPDRLSVEAMHPREDDSEFLRQVEAYAAAEIPDVYAENDPLLYRLQSPSRLLRKTPRLASEIDSVLTSDGDLSLIMLAGIIDTAQQSHAPANEKPFNKLLTYATLCLSVDARQPEDNNESMRTDALMWLLSKKVADSFEPEQLIEATMSAAYLRKRVRELYEAEVDGKKQRDLWGLCQRVDALYSDIGIRKEAYAYIGRLTQEDDIPVDAEQLRLESEHSRLLFEKILSTRRYGMKPGYIAYEGGGTLIFNPAMDFNDVPEVRQMHPIMATGASVAFIIHSRKQRHTTLKLETTRDISEALSLDMGPLDPIIRLELGPDGELYTDRDCRTSFLAIAVECGKYAAYRTLQAEVVADYFDLTHPAADVARIKQAAQSVPVDSQRNRDQSPRDTIERLVVPRAYFYSQSEAGGVRPSTDEEEPAIRTVRRHDVTWHIRVLPEGWHASPEAHETAASLGVKLKAGETIVRAHSRGAAEIGQVVAHFFVSRDETAGLDDKL
ncbi:MAG TPA: hypothetical protein VLG92_04730 [Candidatus Saccharimonadia bacterium]|nr:hypothetical protein [Candidatus Saccharimonadia bacterium]